MEETRSYPDDKQRSQWVERERVAPHERDGWTEFEYELYEDDEESKRSDGLPFLIVNHKAQMRETHQRIMRGPNGGLMHVDAGEVVDVETFLAEDARAYRWVGKDRNGDWLAEDGRTLPPFVFPAAPWAGGRDEELDPQWQRETYQIPLDGQVRDAKRRRIDRAQAKGESGDKRGTTLNLQVGASADDAWEDAGSVNITQTNARITSSGEWFGYRWTSVSIPSGSTIDGAVLSTVINSSANDDVDNIVYAEDVADASAFTNTANNVSGRSRTTASDVWTENLGAQADERWEWGATSADGPNAGGVSLASLVQEVIDGGSWSDGNSLAMLVTFNGSCQFGNWFYDWDTALSAGLDIDYTAGGGGGGNTRRYRLTTLGVG